MKKVMLLTAFSAISLLGFSQENSGSAFSKGSSVIGVGYGFLSPYKTLFSLSSTIMSFGGVSSKFSSFGPIGFTYEKGVTEKFSVGGQLAISTMKNVNTFTGDVLANGQTYEVTQKLNQVSLVVRGNYHFGSSPNFDPYIGLGLGYGNFKFSTSSNDPDDQAADLAFYNISVPGAFGFTGQLGARYYFNDKVGAYAELGYLAGSFAQIGLVTKF